MTKAHVHIIKTGGTIEFHDPAYEDMNNVLLKLDVSIDSYLSKLIKPHFTYSIEEAFSKDSRDIIDQDRQKLLDAISTSPHENIVITHGTFTMRETAEFIEKQLPDGKKVILTGAMIPITGFASSDAGFNLGYAIGSFVGLQPGVYLSMNGGVFSPKEVTKNTDIFRFE
jgi:L-asparaginase